MSAREIAIAALHSRLVTSLAVRNPAPIVLRGETIPQRIPPGGIVMAVAGVGILVNGFTAWLFARGSGHGGDVNIRGAYLHMLADAGISAAVVVSGLVMLNTGAAWIDPALSLVVVAVIVRGTWALLRESVALALDAVPAGIDTAAVTAFLAARPGVAAVHHLHIWPMGTTDTAMTVHLLMPAGHPGDAVLAALTHDIEHRFAIAHVTVQVETGTGDCRQAACG